MKTWCSQNKFFKVFFKKFIIQWHLVFVQCCTTTIALVSTFFLSLQKITSYSYFPLPHSLVSANLLSVSTGLSIPGMLYKRNQTKYGLLCLAFSLGMFLRFMQLVEKAMATHSSTLAWKIPWTEEPGRLRSIRLRRVRHDWATSLSLFTFLHWRRKWQSTPVFLPGESQGRGSLVGCHLWGRTELDMTEMI